uniref:RRM domain-containing protein n=1 Tax=Oryza glaberrima TaxID=4538 RepID=I1QZ01_ORYGL
MTFPLQVKTIYVKNLPENASKEKIKEIFEKHGEVTKVVLPPAKDGHKRDFGFVHFAERSSALKAVKGSEKYEFDGNVFSLFIIYHYLWNLVFFV